jgi:hypothetical protein
LNKGNSFNNFGDFNFDKYKEDAPVMEEFDEVMPQGYGSSRQEKGMVEPEIIRDKPPKAGYMSNRYGQQGRPPTSSNPKMAQILSIKKRLKQQQLQAMRDLEKKN